MNLDRKTHRHLIEPLSGHCHLKTVLYARYVNFYDRLLESQKFTVQFKAKLFENHQRSTFGKQCNFYLIHVTLAPLKNLMLPVG